MGIKEPIIGVHVNVEVATRKFIPDPNGDVIGLDGVKGRYDTWEKQAVSNLLTDDGRDFLHQQGYETSSLGTNGGNYIALTTDGAAPDVTDSTLASEITTGGLERAQGSVAHVAGNTTSTITKTFTASAAHTGVQKSGLFTASTAGTMVHEATFSSVNLQNNDQLQVTWTITLS